MKRVMAGSVLMALWVCAVVPRAALAYVDPGTGGMLFQLLAVAFASITALLLFS